MNKSSVIAFLGVFFAFFFTDIRAADAALLFTNDLYDAAPYNFTLDAAGTASSEISLTFGENVQEHLIWDIANSRFKLSDDLRVEGNAAVLGQVYVANDHTVSDSTGSISLGRSSGVWQTIQWNTATGRFEIGGATHVAGDVSATGNVNFANSTQMHLREVMNTASLPCTTLSEIVFNTTDHTLYTCTAVGNPGTWSAVGGSGGGGSTQDFEGVYATDTGKNLVTVNNPFSIITGTNDFIVDSADWNITAAGAFDAATITANGLLTGLAGATIQGGVINFNAGTNFVTNINTGTSTGQVNIGGGANCVKVDSTTWDTTCAGAISGLTGVSSTGAINFTSASSFQMPQAASDPATCTSGQMYYNTTTSSVRLCVGTNAWSGAGAAGSQYVFAYDTTTQTVVTAGTFQDVLYAVNGEVDGWSHTAGSSSFTATVAGTYMINMTARVAKAGGANTTISFRGVKNGVEVPGSQSYGTASGSSGDTLSGNFIVTVAAGDIIKIQMTGGTNQVRIVPGGQGTILPSTQLSIWRLK